MTRAVLGSRRNGSVRWVLESARAGEKTAIPQFKIRNIREIREIRGSGNYQF